MERTKLEKCIENFRELYFDIDQRKFEDVVSEAVSRSYSDLKRVMIGVGECTKARDIALNCMTDGIKTCINNKMNSQEEFDKMHRDLCEKWKNSFKEKEKLGFCGKAQKIINMSFKYIYCYYYGRGNTNIDIKVFDYCHMPLDSYILKALKVVNDNSEKKKIINYDTIWSNIDDYDKYIEIQKIARECLLVDDFTVLEKEFVLWDCVRVYEANKKYSEVKKSLNYLNDIFKVDYLSERDFEEYKLVNYIDDIIGFGE